MKYKVLVIEDEVKIADWLVVYFEEAGFYAEAVYNGKEGLARARDVNPDIIILDIMLPGMNGREICRILRKETDTPIIMLTAHDSHSDRISGLDTGADDYITKPFDPNEVVARVRAVLRRVKEKIQRHITYNNIFLDEVKETVALNGKQLNLSHAQFQILSVFMHHPNQVLNRDQLAELAFNNKFDAFDRAIDNHILRLRKQINIDGIQSIQTVYGSGYKFVTEDE